MLAEAFCASDDRVRHAQSILDQAQADRTRTLAAFAVAVGSDGGVANLMGLNEREVRIARRTVGKKHARTVADELLSQHTVVAPQQEVTPEPNSEPPLPPPPPPPTVPPTAVPAPRPETPQFHVGTDTAPPTGVVSQETVAWTPSMDAVLQWSWQSGLDLATVAAELGLDPRALLLRVQQLAAEGRLTVKAAQNDTGQAGRHRRHEPHRHEPHRHEPLHIPVPDSPESLYTAYSQPYV